MTGFDAYFYECKFFINGKKEYSLGEILTKYLSKNFKNLDDTLHKCKKFAGQLHYPEDMDEAENCDELFQRAIVFYDNLDEMICSLPPYKDMDLRRNRLYDLLNEDIALWEWDDEFEENEVDYLEHFTTDYPLNKQNDADMIDYILKFNDKLKAFTN